MANVEHVATLDPNIHEPKGIASATVDTAYIANGTGSGTFKEVTPTGTFVTDINVASGQQFANQGPSALDTAHQLLFGAGGTLTGDITIDALGALTVTTPGTYSFFLVETFGRSTSSGVSRLNTRLLVNGIQTGFSGSFFLAASSDRLTESFSFSLELLAADVVTFELIRDGAGTNDGGLFTETVVAAGWVDSPSASITVAKILV